jgi:hypothetical protein
MGKIIRVEAEDRNVAFGQFQNDGVRVDILFVGNNQNGRRHCSTLKTFSRRQEQDASSSCSGSPLLSFQSLYQSQREESRSRTTIVIDRN